MKLICYFFFIVFSIGLKAQNNPPVSPPKATSETNFECELVLDIYDAFADWKSSPPKFWGGKNAPKSTIDKVMVGALCVANKNDTNGNGTTDGSENNVVNSNHRNEIDLMKLVLRPRENGNALSGDITLSKESGNNIKIWTTPEKATGTQINLPLTINASTLPKTWYVEATEPSTSARDIILSATYQGKKEIVKATAVWVVLEETYDNASDNPDMNALGVGGCIQSAINKNISPDGTKFGFGSIGSDLTQKIGSRILFQWKLFPTDAYNIVQVDGTRQRSTKNWSVNMDLTTGPDCKFVLKTEPFPFDANQDNELPNDDKSIEPTIDGIKKCDDNINGIQLNGRFFTYDAPAIATKEEFIINKSPFPLWRAFVDDKTNFYEFIRLGPKETEFNPPVNSNGLLNGSRASDKMSWSNAYYTKKDKTFTLAKDDTPIGLNHVRVNNMKDDHTNYPIEYTTNLTPTSYQLGTYSIFVFRDQTERAYTAVRLVPNGDGGCMTEESTIGAIPLATNPYSIAFDQHLIEIKEINAIDYILTLNWHTFQSPNKLNNLSGNSYITNLNH